MFIASTFFGSCQFSRVGFEFLFLFFVFEGGGGLVIFWERETLAQRVKITSFSPPFFSFISFVNECNCTINRAICF